jgi:acyl carrier protein
MASGGRFVEIGVRGILENRTLGLRPFERSLSYSFLDLTQLLAAQPQRCMAVLSEILAAFKNGDLASLPVRTFSIRAAASAFRFMAQAKHIGKIALRMEERAKVLPTRTSQAFSADASYLVTGGLGGLGLCVAKWMVERGARHLVLLGRSGHSHASHDEVRALEEAGASVRVVRADVSDPQQVAGVFREIRRSGPALRGVVHAAGVLDDAVLVNQDAQRFRAVLGPKVAGAWNLHSETRDLALDFFLLFSSAASVLGSPGQGNYAAGNAFLDALAAHRHACGLPALAINWGPWSDVGGAADAETLGRLESVGVLSIAPHEGIAILERIRNTERAQIMALRSDLTLLRGCDAGSPHWWFLSELAAAAGGDRGFPILEAIRGLTTAGERYRGLESYVNRELSRVLLVDEAQLGQNVSFEDLGMDSLMAIELRNGLQSTLGVSLATSALVRNPTFSAITRVIAAQLGIQVDSATSEEAADRGGA